MTARVGFLALLAVGTAAASEMSLESGPVPVELDGLDGFECEGRVTWEQLPNGATAVASQEDACYPFRVDAADNFVGDGETLIGVGWWGAYWNGSPSPPDAFDITIYAHDEGLPGERLAAFRATAYDEAIGDPNGYCAPIDGFEKVDGVTYHLGVQAVLCFPPQWGWATGAGDGIEGHFLGLLGYPVWVPLSIPFLVPYDLSMVLFDTGHDPTPVDDTSWSGIKRQYRPARSPAR